MHGVANSARATLVLLVALLAVVPGAAVAAPLVGAAGDIACSPNSRHFNGGQGTATECRQLHTSEQMMGRGFDAALPLGDNQYRFGSFEGFRSSYHPSWGRLKPITRPVPGNHDYGTPAARGYFDYFNGVGERDGAAGRRGRGYYSFDLGRWHLVALNSNCGEVRCGAGSPQLRWLRSDLRRSKRRCVLAYAHHPRFSSGDHGDTERMRPLFRTLVRAGADLLLSGNDHHYERFAPRRAGGVVDRPRGTRQFVVGTGGSRLIGLPSQRSAASRRAIDTAFGILRLRLRRGSYRWRFVSDAGAALDRGQARCHGRLR